MKNEMFVAQTELHSQKWHRYLKSNYFSFNLTLNRLDCLDVGNNSQFNGHIKCICALMHECYTGIINELTANAAFNTGIDFMNTDHYCITLRVQRLFDFSFLFICLVLLLSQSHIYLSNPYGTIWDIYSLTA